MGCERKTDVQYEIKLGGDTEIWPLYCYSIAQASSLRPYAGYKRSNHMVAEVGLSFSSIRTGSVRQVKFRCVFSASKIHNTLSCTVT